MCIGKGAFTERISRTLSGSSLVISFTYSTRRPMNEATLATREPSRRGPSPSRRASRRPPIHSGSFAGSLM